MKTRSSSNTTHESNNGDNVVELFKSNFKRRGIHFHLGIQNENKSNEIVSPLSEQFDVFVSMLDTCLKSEQMNFVIAGPCDSGKTALLLKGMDYIKALPIEDKAPVKVISGHVLKKKFLLNPQSLTNLLRSCVEVELSEEVSLVCGEVTFLELGVKPAGDKKFSKGTGEGRTAPKKRKRDEDEIPVFISALMTLATKEMKATYRVGPLLAQKLAQEQILPGDIIEVNRSTGELRRLGRSTRLVGEDELYNSFQRFLPVPAGDIQQVTTQKLSMLLSEMDALNQEGESMSSLLGSGKETSASSEILKSVDEKVEEWLEQGRAGLRKGVLFVDNCDEAGEEALSVIHRKLVGSNFSPSIVLVTNKIATEDQGVFCPLGIPIEFLDKCLVLQTKAYEDSEVFNILSNLVSSGLAEFLFSLYKDEGLKYTFRVLSEAVFKKKRGVSQSVSKEVSEGESASQAGLEKALRELKKVDIEEIISIFPSVKKIKLELAEKNIELIENK